MSLSHCRPNATCASPHGADASRGHRDIQHKCISRMLPLPSPLQRTHVIAEFIVIVLVGCRRNGLIHPSRYLR